MPSQDVIDPHRVWRKCRRCARETFLLFTKPLGTGGHHDSAERRPSHAGTVAAAIAAMTTLNRDAALALQKLRKSQLCKTRPRRYWTSLVSACLATPARWRSAIRRAGMEPVSFEIDHRAFAYFPGAAEAAREGHLSGGLKNNPRLYWRLRPLRRQCPARISGFAFRSPNFRRTARFHLRRIRRRAFSALDRHGGLRPPHRPGRGKEKPASLCSLEP